MLPRQTNKMRVFIVAKIVIHPKRYNLHHAANEINSLIGHSFSKKIVTLPRFIADTCRPEMTTVMKMKICMLLAAMTLSVTGAAAQTNYKKVHNITLADLHKTPSQLPYFGEKNLMIFYVDPEAHKQNEAFTYELEDNHYAESPEIYGFGVINAKDAWYPNGLIRTMARKRTEKNGALVLMDDNRILAQQWGLGDCNDKFVLLFVNKAGELVFIRKGELTEQDKKEFYAVIDQYK